MNNLAAAVELVAKWRGLQEKFSDYETTAGACYRKCADELETILAELGMDAGDEPKHVFEIPVDRYDWTEGGMEIISKNQSGPNEYVKYDDYEKLYNTRPPVAGLDELTDEQWADFEDAMLFCMSNGQDFKHAVREFLGKVDG